MVMPLYTHIRNISSRNLEYINNYNIEMNYFLIQIVFYLIIGTISLVCDKEYFYIKLEFRRFFKYKYQLL